MINDQSGITTVSLWGISAHFPDPDDLECLVRTAAEAVHGDLSELSTRQTELARRAYEHLMSENEDQAHPAPTAESRPGFALNLAGLIIHGDGTRQTVSELGWTDLSPDQLARIALVLAENDPYYTITAADVGAVVLHAFGRAWQVVNFMGRISHVDVGKRVYRTDTPGGPVLSVESDAQRAARQAR